MNLEQIFADFLKKEKLIDQKILLLVSGGVDSVVLLNIATKVYDKKLIEVLHFNHNSRKNCDQDMKFTEKICQKLKVIFHGETLPVIKKGDQENQWRKLRQEISKNLAKKIGATKTLTAHHATDLVETMIFRLTKGCGPSGLSPFDISLKPFWQAPKSELIKYAKENNLEWREDETNKNFIHNRNLIRHKVLPELRKITTNIEQVFVREAEIFAGISEFLNQEISEKVAKKEILLSSFLRLPFILQTELLREITHRAPQDNGKIPSMSEVNDCLKWLTNNPQGNSAKKIGKVELKVIKRTIVWQ